MSMPPESGWQPPQQSGPPPNQGQPYGQQFNPSGYNPQQPPPPGWQQGSWPQPPGPPPPKGSSLKWLLIAVAVLLVIGISVGATLIFTRDGGGGGGTTPTSGAPSDIASAGDTGPVEVITDEPTCKSFLSINDSLSELQKRGWGEQRSTLGPLDEWTPEQHTQLESVATAIRNSADQMVPLAQQTPHRSVRELYEQFIAYGRAYAASIATYVPMDNELASANVNISATLFGICEAIEYGASNRSIALSPAESPTNASHPRNSAEPERFISTSDETCSKWSESSDQFNARTTEWQNLDPNIPMSDWTPDRRATEQAARPFVTTWANDMESLGRQSGNPTLEDFAATASVYLRAYVSVGDDYVGADSWLRYVAYKINQTVLAACRAADR
jgi:hypothetical protein